MLWSWSVVTLSASRDPPRGHPHGLLGHVTQSGGNFYAKKVRPNRSNTVATNRTLSDSNALLR